MSYRKYNIFKKAETISIIQFCKLNKALFCKIGHKFMKNITGKETAGYSIIINTCKILINALAKIIQQFINKMID